MYQFFIGETTNDCFCLFRKEETTERLTPNVSANIPIYSLFIIFLLFLFCFLNLENYLYLLSEFTKVIKT